MNSYPDFSLHFLGKWKEGALPITGDGVVVVSHDQTHHAYSVTRDEYDDFVFWAVGTWEGADIDIQVTQTSERLK